MSRSNPTDKNLSFCDLPEFHHNRSKENNHYSQLPILKNLVELENTKAVLSQLNEIDWDFTDEDTTYLSHDIHPYPAKFIPQIPSHLISYLSRPGELVWDPFGGSGTTALEAILLNRRAVSTDANPLAKIIGMAKIITLTMEEETELGIWKDHLAFLSDDPDSYSQLISESQPEWEVLVPEIPNIEHWFNKNAISELAYIRYLINKHDNDHFRVLSNVALSRSILNVSYQDSETRYSRREKDIPFRKTMKQFVRELDYCLTRTTQLGKLIGFRKADFETLDLREAIVADRHLVNCDVKRNILSPNSVDLIVTSPPYPNATDYHLYHRFRLFWLGYDPRKLGKVEIGSHLRHQKEGSGFNQYLEEMSLSLQNMLKALRPGRYAVLVLGDGVYEGEVYPTAERVGEVADELGLNVIGLIRRSIHKSKRSFAAPARRAREEWLLVLRKPNKQSQFILCSPNYQTRGYEDVLRKEEVVGLTGNSPINNNESTWEINATPLDADKFRRLAFTHSFSSTDFKPELSWQALLEYGHDGPINSRKESTYLTHGIHSYKGKFYPQLANSLINISGMKEGDKVLDPFCGSGTLPLEGFLRGLNTFGCDLSPLAVKIARSKVQILTVEPFQRDRLLYQAQQMIEQDRISFDNLDWLERYADDTQNEITRWFPWKVLEQFSIIMSAIAKTPHPIVQEFLEILLSSIVRQVSQQDPRDLRTRRRKDLIDNAPAIELFLDLLKSQRRKLVEFDKVRNYAPNSMGSARIWLGDTTKFESFEKAGVEANSIDLVLTSPPYATALPYIDTDRLSFLLLFGMGASDRRPLERKMSGTREITTKRRKYFESLIESGDFSRFNSKRAQEIISKIYFANKVSDVGFRRENLPSLLYKYYAEMSDSLTNIDRLLSHRGQVFLILGNNKTKLGTGDWMEIDTIEVFKEIAGNQGWILRNEYLISVTTEDYKHAKHSIKDNSILCYSKN